MKKTGVELIAQERNEQIVKHDRTIQKDVQQNGLFQLSFAATILAQEYIHELEPAPKDWNPVVWVHMLTKSYKERLIIAGALIAAEIDRLQFSPMRVFKFYSDDIIYAYSGYDENEAKKALFDEMGEMELDKCEEVPESEWDKKTINVWEDNDYEKEPYQISIRDCMMGETPVLLFTNNVVD